MKRTDENSSGVVGRGGLVFGIIATFILVGALYLVTAPDPSDLDFPMTLGEIRGYLVPILILALVLLGAYHYLTEDL